MVEEAVELRVELDFIPISFAGPRITRAMNRGVRIVKMMKALVRTLSRYSRLMISRVLRILTSRGFALDSVDKDLFKRGFYEFEPADAGRLSCELQEFLRIRAGCEFQLDRVP